MKDILNNISTLDGFMSNEQFSSVVLSANIRNEVPPICNDYNGPEDPEDFENKMA